MIVIAEVLKRERTIRGWSQTELAKMLGVSQPTIASWETDRTRPSYEYVVELAGMFGVTTDYLLNNNIPPRKRPRRLQDLINEEMFTLNGELATPEDKEKLARLIEAMFYDAKEKNWRQREGKKAR